LGDSEFHVKIENVVAFATLGKDIPLVKVSDKLDGAEYAPDAFPGLIYRITDPKAATLIFSSGKIVCTGAKSVDMAKNAMNTVVDHVRKTGVRLPQKFNTKVENIVASTQIKARLNLEEISFNLENVEYEPEQFPGLVCRIADPRVAFLLFGSGKIICTGARNIDDIHVALGKFKEKLESIGVNVKAIPPDMPAEVADGVVGKPEPEGRGRAVAE
jgi:transcription initiation factor TFIID TATA-box-binding protein